MPNGNLISDAEASKFTEVSAAPIVPGLLPPPRSAASVGASTPELSQGSISSAFQHDVDFVASAPKVPGVPRFSLMPLGIQESAVTSAAIQSQISTASPSTIAPALGNVSLDIPDIFTPVTQSEVFPNPTLAFDLALEDAGTVLAVPSQPVPTVNGLDYNVGASGSSAVTTTATATVPDFNILIADATSGTPTVSAGWVQPTAASLWVQTTQPGAVGTITSTVTPTGAVPGVTNQTAAVMVGFAASTAINTTLITSGGGAWEKTGFSITPTFTSANKVVLAILTVRGATGSYGGSSVSDNVNLWYLIGSAGSLNYDVIPNSYNGDIVAVWICTNPASGTYNVTTYPNLSHTNAVDGANFYIVDITGIDVSEVLQALPRFMDLQPNQIPVGPAVLQTSNYSPVAADSGSLQVFNTSSNSTLALPGTPPSLHWFISVSNVGSGTVAVTPTSPAYLNGSSGTISLTTGQGITIFTDGTDYYSIDGTGSGGGGGVTSLNSLTGALDIVAGTGITVTPSGSNITIDAAIGGVNKQTANYVILSTDAGKIVSMNSSSATTLKLPAASPSANFNVYVENIGTGLCTLDPNGLNLDGSASTVTLPPNQGMYISSDGTNYFSERGLAAPPIPTTLVLTTGSLATGASENDTPAFPKNATLWRVTASQACRIELYATAAAQTADQAGPRPISVPPTPGTQNGVLLDLNLDFLNYTSPWLMSPPALLVNGDSPQNSQLYSTITNLGSTGAITVTFYYYQEGN